MKFEIVQFFIRYSYKCTLSLSKLYSRLFLLQMVVTLFFCYIVAHVSSSDTLEHTGA